MSNLAQRLTFQEILDLVRYSGKYVTYLIQGEPGIGKTTIGKELAKLLGYHLAELDIANMALGDLMMPVTNKEIKATEFYPNEVFGFHLGRPQVIVLDEWTKGNREVKNMTLPLVLERRIGCVRLHPDSIVLATGNLSGDGVGDSIQAHQMDRFVFVEMKKPDNEEWINNFAIPNELDPTLITFASEYPTLFQSYKDDPTGDNPYIFNPRTNSSFFCSPRSLAKASDILRTREHVTERALTAALCGDIGQAAAGDLMSFVNMSEDLPPLKAIAADPEGCKLPDTPVTKLLLTYNLIMRCEKENLSAIVKYIRRMPNEMQAIFANKVLSTPSKSTFATSNPELSKLCTEKHYLFRG